ncbi:thiamine pyrophosphate-binding protein [Paralimibaculum aggregatum]|uniref:Thiamine pyrophosphate-binding protein n=1 Tax=Paralimibaculum aggregatum TaxID=3036245 RepID=A0ABQ6LLJ2_9RHOB|nr:thiamine pyrophosphate-binding protein [Limibaculum sp. NKW23]GMG83150.1 thiamine pyrophosphate-binding protein [Limibaculum sp. NKW23]
MKRMKGADVIADVLVQEGVPYVFGICGHGNVGMIDALHERQDRITFVSPRHEQTAGHMADAYFRVAHKPVATLTSCGPGSANMPMSLACAQADSSAFLAITANVPTSQFNRGPFQESYHHYQADFPSVVRPYVKRSFQPSRVDMLPVAMRQAMHLMTSGRPGPVNLDVPYNVFQEEDAVTLPAVRGGAPVNRLGASPEDVAQTAGMLLSAERPLIFIGHGVTLSEAGPELTELVDRLGIAVVMSPNGMGALDMAHPLSLGFIGRNGTYAANEAGRRCDVLLTLGARFDDRSSSSWKQGYSWNIPPTRLVQVDIDVAEIARNYDPALGVCADIRTFLRQLLAEIEARGGADAARRRGAHWRERIAGWKAEWEAHIRPAFLADTSPMRPERVVREVQGALPEDAILVCDSGVHHNWFMQFWQARRPQRMLNTWGFSAMGFGVSGVLGAKLAAPQSPCVAVVGDGGFTMTPHVLCTAVEYDIPVVWVIWNNYAWGAIRDLQLGPFGGRELNTSFTAGDNQAPYNPDFGAMARAHGVEGVKVSSAGEFGDALAHAIAANKPFVIDAEVDVNVKPQSVGTWELPPLRHPEPAFGLPWSPA